MLVSIHQIQLSTFFLAISHMPVYAVADANASAQGIAPGAKLCLSAHRAIQSNMKQARKNISCMIHSFRLE